MELVSILVPHIVQDTFRIGAGGFFQDRGQSGAGVFDVEIEVAGEEGFLAEEGAAEIGFAVDVDAGAGFYVLGQELGQNYLLGEEFGADGEMGLSFSAAGKKNEGEEKDSAETRRTLRGRREERHRERQEFNTEFTED
jgi:hypothetical protein